MNIPNQTFAKPKEALAFDFAAGNPGAVEVTVGRGRPSKAMRDRLDFLLAQGWKVSGYRSGKPSASPAAPAVEGSAPAPAPRAERVNNGDNYGELPPQFRGDDLDAFYTDGEKSVRLAIGVKGVCECHRVSMTFCPSSAPLMWNNRGDSLVRVSFKTRKVSA